jgi:curved DNA-binding protein CbpA
MRDKETPDYYYILGISPTATSLEIKGRYRALSKQHHPDMGGNQKEMAQINTAYHVLSDQLKRAIYDAERKHRLHVPPRPTAVRQQPAPTRRPVVKTQPQHTTAPKRHTNWWARFAWGFAAIVIVVGLLMQLPIAEALDNNRADTQSAVKPLDVTYEPDNSSPTSSTLTTAPENTSSSTTTPDAASAAPTAGQTKNQTCNTDASSTDDQTCSRKSCITKSIGFYKHTVCSAPRGGTSCSNSIDANYRYTDCY